MPVDSPGLELSGLRPSHRQSPLPPVTAMSPASPPQQLLLSFLWALVGVALVYGGTRLFDRLDPLDYRAEIRKGNVAAGLVMAAVILSVAAVVVVVLAT